MRRWIIVGLIAVILIGITIISTTAQESCSGVEVFNDSSEDINLSAVCDAATQWTDRGFRIYIAVTDGNVGSEDEWFAFRDEREIDEWGIYDPTNPDQSFSKHALAIELSLNTTRPWGHDVAFGEELFDTPLDTDAAVARTEEQLKRAVEQGDVTQAITTTLNSTYEIAYPVVSQPTQPSQDGVSSVNNDEETSAVGASTVLLVLVVFVIVGALIAGIYFVGVPRGREWMDRRTALKQQQDHFAKIDQTNRVLIGAAGTVLDGSTVEESTLFEWFDLAGGTNDHDLAERVRTLIGDGQEALREVADLLGEIEHSEPRDGDLEPFIRASEQIYATLLGTEQRVLSMDEKQLREFVDPMNVGRLVPESTSPLMEQLKRGREFITDQPLRVELKHIDESNMDARGVFGYAFEVKQIIADLMEAKENYPEQIRAAQATRELVEWNKLPTGLTAAVVYAQADSFIQQAKTHAEASRWLPAVTAAENAAKTVQEITGMMPKVTDAKEHSRVKLQETREIANQGFRIGDLEADGHEAERIWTALVEQLSNGDLDAVAHSITNLTDHADAVYDRGYQLVKQHARNTEQIGLLSQRVSILQRRLEAVQVHEWRQLQTFPRSNWDDVAGNLDQAENLLTALFDNPADPEDQASVIAQLNSLDRQDFIGAEKALKQAIADADKAETLITSVTARYSVVALIRTDQDKALQKATDAVSRAVERRDADAEKINADVDQLIKDARSLLTKALNSYREQNFLQAQEEVKLILEKATAAHASAEEQVAEVNGLYRAQTSGKREAQVAIAGAKQLLADNPITIRTQKARELMLRAEELYQQALRQESQGIGMEDRHLVSWMKLVISAYETAESTALDAKDQILRDKHHYEEQYRLAQEAVSSARIAIEQAETAVADPDAYEAGTTSLSQANAIMLSDPEYGDDIEALGRLKSLANRASHLARTAQSQAEQKTAHVRSEREAERVRQAAILAQQASVTRTRESRRETMDVVRRSSTPSLTRRSSMGSGSSRSRVSTFSSSSRSSRKSNMGSSRRR